MKLGNIKGERAVEVIAEIIEPISNIATDERTAKLFRLDKNEGETDRESAIRNFTGKVPDLLKSHKKDVVAILCAINNVKPEDLTLMDIIHGAADLVSDQDFLSLFLSAADSTDEIPPTESSEIVERSEPES